MSLLSRGGSQELYAGASDHSRISNLLCFKLPDESRWVYRGIGHGINADIQRTPMRMRLRAPTREVYVGTVKENVYLYFVSRL